MDKEASMNNIPAISETEFTMPPRRGVSIPVVVIICLVVSIVSVYAAVMLTVQQYSSAVGEQTNNLDMITKVVSNEKVSDEDKLEMINTIIGDEAIAQAQTDMEESSASD